MAAKLTLQDIEDAGFRREQFGTPADWAEELPPGYVARLLRDVGLWARGRFGAGYDAVAEGTPAWQHLRAAELCYASHVLWKRRAAFIDSNAVSALDNLVHADRREYEAQAARARECAEENMALATGSVPAASGGALSHAESGPWRRHHGRVGLA